MTGRAVLVLETDLKCRRNILSLYHQTAHTTFWHCFTRLYLSQWCPVVKSLQPWHSPVCGWQYSLWPLHWHGLQWGKPQKPGRQWEHWRPEAPGWHSHWPVASWQKALTEPRGSHSQAEGDIWAVTLSCYWVKWASKHEAVPHLRLQPAGLNWNMAGAQWSQFLPTTLGRHRHWPPLGSHTALSEPWGSHWHAGSKVEIYECTVIRPSVLWFPRFIYLLLQDEQVYWGFFGLNSHIK